MEECWKDVPGYVGQYQVSSHGKIRSVDRMILKKYRSGKIDRAHKIGRVLKPKDNGSGYKMVCLPIKKYYYIHRIVADAFLGGIPTGLEVNHIDGNKDNNYVSNLEIVSRKQNNLHSKNVLGNRNQFEEGEKHHLTYLTKDEVLEIKEMITLDVPSKIIEWCFDVSRSVVKRLKFGQTWKHVS